MVTNDKNVRKSRTTKAKFFYGYIIVIAAFITLAITWGTFHAFGIFFNPMVAEFGWTRAMTSGTFSVSLLLSGFSAILMGRLTDKLGPRLVTVICGVLLGLGYILISQINAVWQLYLLYGVLIGIAMGAAWVPLMSTVARWFIDKRSMVTGIVLTGLGIGSLLGPPFASWLISLYDWRTSYVIIGIISLVIVVIVAQFLRRDPEQMGLSPYVEENRDRPAPQTANEGLSFNEAIRTGRFWMFAGTLCCFGFSLYSIMVHLAPHAIDLGISEFSAANILALIGGLGIVGMLVLGSAADKIGNKLVFVIGLALMAAPLLWLMVAEKEWMLYLFAGIFGFGHDGFASSESPMAAKLFGLKAHGTILGTAVLGFSIGAALGPVLTGYIFDLSGSYQLAFLLCAIVCCIGILLSILLKPAKVIIENQIK
jgi:MFS family permease